MNSIEFKNCTKAYGKHIALNNLDLQVKKGEIFGFLGPNGAGKSTTIRMILDLIHPTQGNVEVNGKKVKENSVEIRKLIGYLQGEVAFPKGYSAKDVIFHNLKIHKKNPEYALGLAKRLNLELNTKLNKMSKGMKQKVGIINALAHDPEIIILDEPHTGLDPLMQAEFNKILLEEKEKGKTIFMSSHILSDVEHLADRVGIINKGHLVFVGSVEELKNNMPYIVTIQYGETINVNTIESLQNVKLIKNEEGKMEFQTTSPSSELLKVLATLDVKEVLIQKPPLEEIFMDYYQKVGE